MNNGGHIPKDKDGFDARPSVPTKIDEGVKRIIDDLVKESFELKSQREAFLRRLSKNDEEIASLRNKCASLEYDYWKVTKQAIELIQSSTRFTRRHDSTCGCPRCKAVNILTTLKPTGGVAPPQPPIDNAFVKQGCEQFGVKHD